MRKRLGFLLITGLLGSLILSCAQSGLILPSATSAPTQKEKTATKKPTRAITATRTKTPIPFATATHMPTPTTAVRAPDASHYLLASYSADQMDEYITWMEQRVLSLLNDSFMSGNIEEGPLYRAVWYAVWNALVRFPDDPRADKWSWKLAYYMALAGDGEEASEIYKEKIDLGLNELAIPPEELPDLVPIRGI